MKALNWKYLIVCLPLFLAFCTEERTYKNQGQDLFIMPTAFSPNNDGDNDHYQVVKKYNEFEEELAFFEMTIVNKERQVFQCATQGKICDWDGRINDSLASPGHYFCKIHYRIDGGTDTLKAQTRIRVLR